MRVLSVYFALLLLLMPAGVVVGETPVGDGGPLSSVKKIVLIAGPMDQGPGGHPPGTHEYEKSVLLLKHGLETSPNLGGVYCEVHFDGWPEDPGTLDDADTIVLLCDGADRNENDHPLLVGDRLAQLEQQIDRGCGFVAIHWTLFVPTQAAGEKFLRWIGGYFDYQGGPGGGWYSKIQTATTEPEFVSPDHPISRGLDRFELREEYYYNIRMRPGMPGLSPILATSLPNEPQRQVVAWALERPDGGRGFGFTGGHFFDNWQREPFRRMVLNAIVWTSGADVPEGGVASTLPSEQVLATIPAEAPIRTLIVTGHQHPAHDWRATTKALQETLGHDSRIEVAVVVDPEHLGEASLADYDLLVMNYCNWEREGLSEASREGLVRFVASGKGLVLIHFANGAFLDWPEWRQLCRRVWIDGISGHDNYGEFVVEIANDDHPITAGMSSFETIDELYFRQQGDDSVEVLATARSAVTGEDEPMAMVYRFGKGRVFQTVLGHAAESLRTPGTSTLVRRGSVWAAGRPLRESDSSLGAVQPTAEDVLVEGRFGRALDARLGGAMATSNPAYRTLPLTVECWAQLNSKANFNILVASAAKESPEHWEIYSYAQSGEFSAYLPGYHAEIKSGVDITDGAWHHVAMTFDGTRVALYVDGRLAKEATVERVAPGTMAGPLWFGCYPPGNIGCDGLVDDVRISNAIRSIDGVPAGPLAVDEQTVGLWRFDDVSNETYSDASSLGNAARPRLVRVGLPDVSTYRINDPGLKVVPVDRSATDSFLSIRADSAGRLFVGGRESLFVYEPRPGGGYAPRRELYRFPPHSWIADVAVRGDDLYVMTSSALYLLPGARTKRDGIEARRLIWGLPLDLHVSYHAMAWGPEGDLYFNSGDPLLNYGDTKRPDHWGHWTIHCQPEGTRVPYTGVGGVFRCRPDGSNFQVVATGTRGSFGMVFDRQWNLFSNDNDHESQPALYTPARLLHVTPHADFGWPRGWSRQKSPERADLLDLVFDGMGRGVPVGQAYYDDPLLPQLRGNLLVARWGRAGVSRYPLVPAGATFRADEHFLLEGDPQARPVGVSVGRGGRLFVAVSHMAHNEWSPAYPTDLLMVTRNDDPRGYPFEAYDVTTVPAEALWGDLSSSSWSRRNEAHVEILRRGGRLLEEAVGRMRAIHPDDPAANHLPWLAAASGSDKALALLLECAGREGPLQRQALRALAEFYLPPRTDQASGGREAEQLAATFRAALGSPDPQIVQAGLLAYYQLPGELPPEIVSGPARSDDSYLRQAATRLLARRAPLVQLEAMCGADDPATRRAGVLAAGVRLTVPPADWIPPAGVVQPYTSPNADFAIPYADGTVDIREHALIGSFTIAEAWRSVPRTSEQETLFQLLSKRLDDDDRAVRLQAAYYLYLLNDESIDSRVEGVVNQARRSQLASVSPRPVDAAWFVGPFDDGSHGLAAIHEPERGAIELSAEYEIAGETRAWRTLQSADGRYDLGDALGGGERASYYAFARLQSAAPQAMMLVVEAKDGVKVWHNGGLIYENAVLRSGQRYENSVFVELQPGSNDLVVRIQNVQDDVTAGLSYRALGDVVVTLPEKLGLGTLAERLRASALAGDRVEIAAEFLDTDWNSAVVEGDAERGRKLFGADGLGCVKCHAITPESSVTGGPSLAEAGKRFTAAYLVESILLPSKQIAPIFRATTIETAGGELLTGLITNETAERLELLLPDATRRGIEKGDIEARELADLSPMPAGIVKSPDELRDLLAYLMSDDPQAP